MISLLVKCPGITGRPSAVNLTIGNQPLFFLHNKAFIHLEVFRCSRIITSNFLNLVIYIIKGLTVVYSKILKPLFPTEQEDRQEKAAK